MVEQKLTFREQMKGFPVWQMTVVSLIRFSEPITFTSLFPYVYFMIRDFGVAKDKSDISKYSGYLASSFAFLQFLCCVHWGTASDKVGRKKILLCGLFGSSVSILMFGFSRNYYMALFARSCMGALNGNISVLRTVIGEIATERRHQAVAFSTLTLLWNVGGVIGPMLGGSKYLTRPKGMDSEVPTSFLIQKVTMRLQNSEIFNKDSLYERFMTKYPYALSNIVVACFLWFSMITGFLFLEETHAKFKNKRDYGLELGDFLRTKLGFKVPVRPWQKTDLLLQESEIDSSLPSVFTVSQDEENSDSEDPISEFTPLNQTQQLYDPTAGNDNDSSSSIESVGPISRRMSAAIIRRYSSCEVRPTLSRTNDNGSILTTNTEQGFNSKVFTKPVIQSMTASFLISFHNLVYIEFLPVLLAGELLADEIRFPFTIKGGFGYDSSAIGSLLSSTGLVGVLAIIFIFPIIDRNLKTIDGFRLSLIIIPFNYFVLPFLIFTLHDYNPVYPKWLTKVLLYFVCGSNALSCAISFAQTFILIHRASKQKHRAFINGTSLSLSSLARFIAPLLWGWIISVTERYSINEVSWVLLSLLAFICLVQAFFFMDEYDEDLKVTDENSI